MYNPVLGTVEEFIDYALVIVALLLIYYVIKFFTIGGASRQDKEKEWQERGGKTREWLGEKHKEMEKKAGEVKEKKEQEKKIKKRERKLSPIKGFLIRVEKNADELVGHLEKRTDKELEQAKDRLEAVEKDLRSAKKILRAVKHETKAESRNILNNLETYCEAIIVETVRKDIKDWMPSSETDGSWPAKLANIQKAVRKLKNECGHLMNSVDEFIEKDSASVPTFSPSGRGPPPYGASP